ncbi:unnamed protein product [Paramecium sonneborni]|uniref:Protein kinase domain-containing protein n=1 Tax=Paramecium sonneborni TaxID=65129 RepID=A0A8S1MIP4_9CILI|nr:unnamed protein product [Paramecium sonneborni]
MLEFQLRPSNLKSSGFKIYEASNNLEVQYFAYYYTQAYNEAYRQLDLQPISEFLREPINISNTASRYVFFKYCGSFRLADITKKLIETEIINILGQLIQAIYALNKCKLMGRCFNIYNILVTNIQKGKFCIKLMDFGFGPPLDYQPITSYLNNGYYDYQFDLFLIGRILFFLLTNKDIPDHEEHVQMWNETINNINRSSYSKNLQDICKKLISPNQQIGYNFLNLVSDVLKLTEHEFKFDQIQQFYSQNQDIFLEINQEIQRRDKIILIIPKLIPPILPEQSLDRILIFGFEPESIEIHKYLNFKLFNITIIKYAIENIKLKFNPSDHISVPLSLFVLEKMKCIILCKLCLMFENKNFEIFSTQVIQDFIQSSQYKNCLAKLKELKYLQIQEMSTHLETLYKTLQANFPDYQNNLIYKDTYKFLSKDNFISKFEEIKSQYRLPLNNLITKIENLDEDKSNRQFRLEVLMSILINKIGEIKNTHYRTIMKSQQINEINSLLQVNDFLFKANIQELDEQYDELRSLYFR